MGNHTIQTTPPVERALKKSSTTLGKRKNEANPESEDI